MLSVYKWGPKFYILLQILLPLPTKCFLQSVLNTIALSTSIIAYVFHAVQQSLQETSDTVQYCCLMFDKMSILQNLHFNQMLICTGCFEDCGSLCQTWMICGLHTKWKAEVTVQYLKEIADAFHKVVTTVWNMGASNIRTFKMLSVMKTKPFFRFHCQKMAKMYDPHNLLECTWDLQFYNSFHRDGLRHNLEFMVS
jgi:hypothetical protein